MKMKVRDNEANELLDEVMRLIKKVQKKRTRDLPFHLSLAILEKFGQVIQVFRKSIVFCLLCATVDELDGVWNVCANGTVREALQKDLRDSELLVRFKLEKAEISVEMDAETFDERRADMVAESKTKSDEMSTPSGTPTTGV